MSVHPLKRILIVDDDPDIRQLLKMMLRIEGYDVVGEASNGMDVMKKIEKTMPGIVLLDICMPGSSGFEVLEQVLDKHKELKVIMISGSSTSEDVARAIKKGAAGYIVKPFNTKNVVQNIQRAIQSAVTEIKSQKAS